MNARNRQGNNKKLPDIGTVNIGLPGALNNRVLEVLYFGVFLLFQCLQLCFAVFKLPSQVFGFLAQRSYAAFEKCVLARECESTPNRSGEARRNKSCKNLQNHLFAHDCIVPLHTHCVQSKAGAGVLHGSDTRRYTMNPKPLPLAGSCCTLLQGWCPFGDNLQCRIIRTLHIELLG